MDGDVQLGAKVAQDIKVVDADTHLSEPHDLWTSRVPASWKSRVPHVRPGPKGRPQWYIDGDTILQKKVGASSVIRKDGSKQSFWEWDIRSGMALEDVTPASYDAKARARFMDEQGITAQIAYGNILGFGAHHLARLDPEVAKVTVEVYNDAMAEFQRDSGDRCFPQALVPFWDVKLAAKEVERAARDLKLRGVTMCPEPHANPDLPPLHDPHWDPLWDACSSLDMPINFHVGSSDFSLEAWTSATWPGMDAQRKLVIGNSQLELYNARILANLLTCDLLPRFPKTRWVMVESGLCWIPFIIERLEWQLLDTPFKGKSLDQPGPRELFRNQVYSCFWFEQAAPNRLLDIIGFDNVMFETDFPHATCLYPNGVEHALKSLEPWGEDVKRKVMGGNAAKLYNLPI
jgi:predicted TIM-barrel fold metal-dependent hydrolase